MTSVVLNYLPEVVSKAERLCRSISQEDPDMPAAARGVGELPTLTDAAMLLIGRPGVQ